MIIDDTAKGGLTQFLGTFYLASLHVQGFQMLIKSLFESIWVSNFKEGLCKGRESLLVNFSFPRHKTTELGPQRIMVKVPK